MDVRRINKFYRAESIPLRYLAQLNGKTAQENYNFQKKLMEYERRLEEENYLAIMSSIDSSAGELEQDMANNIGLCLDRVFSGGTIHPEELKHMTFSKNLAIGLGRTIGSIPGLLLEDLFQDD